MIDIISLEYMHRTCLQEFDAEAEKAFQAKVAGGATASLPYCFPPLLPLGVARVNLFRAV